MRWMMMRRSWSSSRNHQWLNVPSDASSSMPRRPESSRPNRCQCAIAGPVMAAPETRDACSDPAAVHTSTDHPTERHRSDTRAESAGVDEDWVVSCGQLTWPEVYRIHLQAVKDLPTDFPRLIAVTGRPTPKLEQLRRRLDVEPRIFQRLGCDVESEPL